MNKQKIKYNITMLEEILIRDASTLIGTYKKLNRETIINFICNCGSEYNKTLRYCYTHKMLCKDCTLSGKINKSKETSIKKYGVDNPVKTIEVREKMKKTNLMRYGVENALQHKETIDKVRNTFLNKYGVEHALQIKEIQIKMKEAFMKKYGVDNPWKSAEVKDKIKKTLKEKYGVETPMLYKPFIEKSWSTSIRKFGTKYCLSSKIIRDKIKQTYLTKYGVAHLSQNEEIRRKVIATNFKRFGVECPLQSEEIKEKGRQTSIKKFGVEYANQNPEMLEKNQNSAKRFKEITLPSGNIRKVQGYEPFAIKELLKNYNENNIITQRKDIPRIKYIHNEKQKYYFPDIYLPCQNKIIEVKSKWTLKLHPEIIKLKEKATKESGYNYEIWCFDCNGNKEIINTDLL